jgi:hypothetical protein
MEGSSMNQQRLVRSVVVLFVLFVTASASGKTKGRILIRPLNSGTVVTLMGDDIRFRAEVLKVAKVKLHQGNLEVFVPSEVPLELVEADNKASITLGEDGEITVHVPVYEDWDVVFLIEKEPAPAEPPAADPFAKEPPVAEPPQ